MQNSSQKSPAYAGVWLPRLQIVFKLLWVVALIAPFIVLKWWAALLVVGLISFSPSMILATAITKPLTPRIGKVWSALLDGLIEGAIFVVILGAIDVLTRLSLSPVETTLLGSSLFIVNQLNRAIKSPNVAAEEALPIPSFIVGAFIGFVVWLFIFWPLTHGY